MNTFAAVDTLDARAHEALLTIARDAIVTGQPLAGDARDDAALQVPGAAFVSIYVDGDLRGCIGLMAWDRPVAAAVHYAATQAATADTRFAPLTAAERDRMALEISVLSPLRPIAPDAIEVGRHGLVVSRGRARGVLLPQVPVKYGWDARHFLERTCAKARLPSDAWRDGATRVEAFEADVFSDGAV